MSMAEFFPTSFGNYSPVVEAAVILEGEGGMNA